VDTGSKEELTVKVGASGQKEKDAEKEAAE
jgi:hypothetical protein